MKKYIYRFWNYLNTIFLGSFTVTLISGCASSKMVRYQVDSTPPGAQIEVDGVSMGKAPTSFELQCSKRWVGMAVAPGGWEYDKVVYEVIAYPTKDNPGLSQSKGVNACQIQQEQGFLHFDLTLDAVAPLQRLDVNINQGDKSKSLDDTIRTLKHLRDQGLLTEDEYQLKVDKAIKNESR